MNKETTFETGQDVRLTSFAGNWHGVGPYPVIRVEPVVDRCNCGASQFYRGFYEPDEIDHHPQCGVRNREMVDHHQWLILQIGEKEHTFSGALATPA